MRLYSDSVRPDSQETERRPGVAFGTEIPFGDRRYRLVACLSGRRAADAARRALP